MDHSLWLGTPRKAYSVVSPRTGKRGCILEITESDESPTSIIRREVERRQWVTCHFSSTKTAKQKLPKLLKLEPLVGMRHRAIHSSGVGGAPTLPGGWWLPHPQMPPTWFRMLLLESKGSGQRCVQRVHEGGVVCLISKSPAWTPASRGKLVPLTVRTGCSCLKWQCPYYPKQLPVECDNYQITHDIFSQN